MSAESVSFSLFIRLFSNADRIEVASSELQVKTCKSVIKGGVKNRCDEIVDYIEAIGNIYR